MPDLGARELTALEKLLRPLSAAMTADLARALVTIQADAATQARYNELAERREAGSLTPDEGAELEALIRANTLLGILKAEARLTLARLPAA